MKEMTVREASQPPIYTDETNGTTVFIERQGCKIRGWIASSVVVDVTQ